VHEDRKNAKNIDHSDLFIQNHEMKMTGKSRKNNKSVNLFWKERGQATRLSQRSTAFSFLLQH